MQFLTKVGLILLYVVAFFVTTGLLAQAHTYFTAESYAQGDTPDQNFPVVAVPKGEPASNGLQYQLMRWADVEKNQRSASPFTFKLSEVHGGFLLPMDGEYQPSVKFDVVETTGNRQLVTVTSLEDSYVFYSKYATDGATVWPMSFRVSGASSMMIALIPGLVLTWLLGRMIAWLWKRRSNATKQVLGLP